MTILNVVKDLRIRSRLHSVRPGKSNTSYFVCHRNTVTENGGSETAALGTNAVDVVFVIATFSSASLESVRFAEVNCPIDTCPTGALAPENVTGSATDRLRFTTTTLLAFTPSVNAKNCR
jgi:hypothetical protein